MCDRLPGRSTEKGRHGVINRAVFKYIRCKSCIVICPFGTLVDDLFTVKGRRSFIHLDKESAVEEFASYFRMMWFHGWMPEKIRQNIYALSGDVS
jgi:hypothetical protein